MDLEDVESDLHSLRKLYGLLQTSGGGLQDANYENLDEKARVLLKNLLDCATERVFETRSKIIAAQSGGLNTPSSTQSELSRRIPRSKPPLPPSTYNVSQQVVQNLSKYLNCPESSQTKKQSLTKPIPREIILEQSKFNIFAFEPENREKVCRSHNQSSMKQQNVAQKTQISNRKAVPTEDVNNQVQFSHFNGSKGEAKGLDSKEKSIEPLRGHEKARQKLEQSMDPRNTELLAALSRTLASGVECSLGTETQKKLDDVDYISKEVADTIKQIESYVPVVQLIDDPVDLGEDKNTAHQGLCEKKFNAIHIADSDSPKVIEREKGLVSRAELSQAGNLGLAQNDLPSQQGIQTLRKHSDSSMRHQVMSLSHKSISEGIDLLGLKKNEPKLPDWVGIETFKLLEKNNSQLNGLESRKGGQTKGSNFPANMLSPIWSPGMGMTTPQSQKMTLVPVQDVKAVVEKFELVNQMASQNDPMASPVYDTVQGFRIPSHKDIVKEAPIPVEVLNQVHKENRNQNLMSQKGTIRKGLTSRSSVMPQSVGTAKKIQATHADQKLNQTGTREQIRKEKNLLPQMIVRPTLLDHCPSQKSLLPSTSSYTDKTIIKGSGKQKQNYVSRHRRIMQPHQQQSEGTDSNSSSSSSWTTQQTSSSCSDSKGKEPLPGQAPLQWRRSGHATHSTSSEEDCSDSIQPQYEHRDSSRGVTGIRKFRSRYSVKSQKAVGPLRRLKNKLAVVFHHHHHHHHHHEDTEAGHSRSLWKYVQKMFHPTIKEEACEEAVEKFKSSAVINAPRKQQGRHHLHAMVEGLLRHIRNSKKTKAGRGGINRVVNEKHGNKRMGKKLHRWQSSGGRGGLKLPNRGRVKLGFKSKKPQLRAGKMK